MTIYSPRSQCDGKRRYKRRRDAKKALRQLQTAGFNDTGIIVYKCPHCGGGYHLGHDVARRLRAKASGR